MVLEGVGDSETKRLGIKVLRGDRICDLRFAPGHIAAMGILDVEMGLGASIFS
jgi:hypothetical protein